MDDQGTNREGGSGMKYRKPRIAWSVGWGIACLLLIIAFVAIAGREKRQPATTPEDAEAIKVREAATNPFATDRDLIALQGKWELVSYKHDWVEANGTTCFYEFED